MFTEVRGGCGLPTFDGLTVWLFLRFSAVLGRKPGVCTAVGLPKETQQYSQQQEVGQPISSFFFIPFLSARVRT